MKKFTPIIIAGVIASAAIAAYQPAQLPSDRHRLEPVLDVPLRDSSICRGPDAWYLTGTLGTPIDKARDKAHDKDSDHPTLDTRHSPLVDFNNNPGIWLWTSDDCENWKELGQVWSIEKQGSAWQKEKRVNPDHPRGPLVRGMVSPEIHYFRDTFWIAYSMNAQGTGLLKSKTGKPEGPYEDLGRMTAEGTDASIFVDDAPSTGSGQGGSVYWVVGQGFIAPMNKDCTALAAKPTLLRPAQWEAQRHGKHTMPWTQAPRTIGQAGAHIFKAEGRYWLCAAQVRGRLGAGCYDTFVCGADQLMGPYDEAFQMIPHGGQTTVFEGPNEKLCATFGGQDRKAIFQDRPAIVPLHFSAEVLYGQGKRKPFPRKIFGLVTAFGPWAEMEPCLPLSIRDLQYIWAPDGYAYLTGSGTDESFGGRIMVLRSRNMADWEVVDVQFDARTLPGMTEEDYEARFVTHAGHLNDKYMDCEIYYAADTFHIFGSLYSIRKNPKRGIDREIPGYGMWLRSTTGKPEGPYEYVNRAPSQCSAFQDDPPSSGNSGEASDGKWYIFNNGNLSDWDPAGGEMGGNRESLLTEMGTRFPAGDVATNLKKIQGKYVVFATAWNGAIIGENERVAATYDKVIWQSDTLKGPYEMPRYADCLPVSGHSCPVQQGPDGRWYGLLFGNDSSGPWWNMPGVLTYDVYLDDEDYIHFDLKDERP